MKKIIALLLCPSLAFAQPFTPQEIARWEAQAKNITVVEDDWGVPHIYGKTDADAVFGLLYVQCQQNFRQVELNNLEMMGRLSEVKGKSYLYEDLKMRLIYDTAAAIADYKRCEPWFRKLLDASADGVNYFLYKHPEVKPAVLKRFEPWFALLRTNGSISATETGDLTLAEIQALYGVADNSTSYIAAPPAYASDPHGSNGFALGPKKTASGNAILYINPHTSFYYRTEAQMVSDEGLNAYGGVTWGTFFVFQGFNENCGWMHTSGATDVVDIYREKIETKGGKRFSVYDGKRLPVETRPILLQYKDGNALRSERFTTYRTVHGPVMGKRGGEWISLRENNRSLDALLQSWLRTKATGFDAFKKVMALRANTSDNTVYADKEGNIAYWHGNFVPRRNPGFDYSRALDGSISSTDWKGLHSLDETVHVYNPETGWIQNCNSTPFTVSGESSPKREAYPTYMAPDAEQPRSVNAIHLLRQANRATLDDMIEIGYNRYLAAFNDLLPPLFSAYGALAPGDSLRTQLSEPIYYLQRWNREAGSASVATTLAVEWAWALAAKTRTSAVPAILSAASPTDLLHALQQVVQDLQKSFGTWKTAWGDVNRYQRSNDGQFTDAAPSWPVALGPGTWGSIPSYSTRRMPSGKRYGVHGNSFVAAVEFGKRLRAKTIMVSGESFDPASPHYTDQAEGYLEGKFKEIHFYKDDVLKHAQRSYHPGE